MVGAFVLALASQALQLKSVSIFEGGPPLEYFKWLTGNKQFVSPLVAIQEDVVKAFGPARVLTFEDLSSRVEPALPSGYLFETKGGYTNFHAKFLPRPIINGAGAFTVDHEDRIVVNRQKAVGGEAPRFEGSLSLNNHLSPLGWNVTVHPFFSDMRVYVRNFGSMGKHVFQQVANCIGGTATFDEKQPNTVRIHPNVPELRKRAIISIDYFNPQNAPRHFQERASLVRRLYESTSDEFFKQWLDQVKDGQPIDVEGTPLHKSVMEYRKIFFDYMESQGKSLFAGESRRHLEAQKIYIVLQKNLCFDLRVQMENGSDLHF